MFGRRKDIKRRTKARPGRTGDIRVRREGPGIRLGGIVVIVLLFGAFVWFAVRPAAAHIAALPVFTVATVAVEGAEHLDRSRIVEVSGIAPGENIFRIDFRKAAEALGKEFAAREFVIYRRLPDTVVIRVKERKPVALLGAGNPVGIDGEGVVLPHIGADMADTLPLITGVDDIRSLADPGVKARVLAGLRLLEAMGKESPGVQKRISEVNVSSLSGLGISLIDTGLEVIVGDTGWNGKLPTLERVIGEVTGLMDSVRTVDLRFGEKVFVNRMRQGTRPRARASADSGTVADGGTVGADGRDVGRRKPSGR